MNRTTFLKSAFFGLCALAVASCSDTPLTSEDVTTDDPIKGASVLAAPSPAIVFIVSNRQLKVIDSDGSDLATIYTAPTSALLRTPTWAPTGAGTSSSPWSISFTEGVSGSSYLKRMNVWVANGKVKSSTPTTVVAYTNTTVNVKLQAWSPSTTTSEIAYTELPGTTGNNARLMVVPVGGGTPTEIYSESGVAMESVSWSPDGSKIAVRSHTAADGSHIRIIDRNRPTTGAAPRVILTGQHASIGLNFDWSRSGTNTLAYDAAATASGTKYLYTTDLSATTPVPTAVTSNSQPVVAYSPTWSPDNTKLLAYMGTGIGSGLKTITLSTGAVSNALTGGSMPNWRR